MRVNSRAANVLRGPGLAGLLVSCSAVPVSSAAVHAVSRPGECVLGPGWQACKASWCCEHASAERRTRRRIKGAGCSRGAPFDPFDSFDAFDWRRLRCALCARGTPDTGWEHGRASRFYENFELSKNNNVDVNLESSPASPWLEMPCPGSQISKVWVWSSKTQVDHIRTNPDDMMVPAAGSYSRTHRPRFGSRGADQTR